MAKLARGRAAASPSGSNSVSSSLLGSVSSSTSGSRSRSRSRSFSSGSASNNSKDRKPPRKKRFHAPKIVLALEHLHSLEIVYRDTGKPENTLIQASFHAMLTDFNLCVSLEVDHSWNQLARGSNIPQESNGGWHRR